MNKGGAFISLTYVASETVIPGYGGGMSSAKAALESDTRTLAYEAGRKYGVRVNTISAGPLASRAAKAIGGAGKEKTLSTTPSITVSLMPPLAKTFSPLILETLQHSCCHHWHVQLLAPPLMLTMVSVQWVWLLMLHPCKVLMSK